MRQFGPSYASMSIRTFEQRLHGMIGGSAEGVLQLMMVREVMQRAMFLGLTIDECKALQNVPRDHPAGEIANIVANATDCPVSKVRFVTPEELEPNMQLWPVEASLWDRNSVSGMFLAINQAGQGRLERAVALIEGFLGDRAANGIERNFQGTDPNLRHALRSTFGWVAGNTIANQIAFCIAHEDERVLAIEPLTMLMASAPFMARHPLRKSELLVLVRN